MPLVNNKELYSDALKKKYILPAFHVWDILSLKAVCEAAVEERSPVIIQLSGHTHPYIEPVDKFITYLKDYITEVDIPILLNHDHTKTPELCRQVIDWGMTSVMYDGSALPYEENIKQTKEVVEYAHQRDIWVEAELGSIPGMEDAEISDDIDYTDPQMAADFIKRTGCDSLTVSVGTAHGGIIAEEHLKIDYERLKDIQTAIGTTPMVLHGGAQLYKEYVDEVNRYGGKVEQLMMCSERTIRETANYGVAKVNMDVDNYLKITARLRKLFMEQPDVYRCKEYFYIMKEPMKEAVKNKMRNVTMSAGKADAFMEYLEGET